MVTPLNGKALLILLKTTAPPRIIAVRWVYSPEPVPDRSIRIMFGFLNFSLVSADNI